MTLALTLPAPSLARVLANCLAHMPARSRFPFCVLDATETALVAWASDGYTLGQDRAEGKSQDFGAEAWVLGLAETKELESWARWCKKREVTMSASKSALTARWAEYEPKDDETEAYELSLSLGETRGVDHLRKLLPLLEKPAQGVGELTVFRPEYLGRWAKTKYEGDTLVMERVGRALRVRQGETFVGLLMPVDLDPDASVSSAHETRHPHRVQEAGM